ncbi:MAG: sporulation protein YtfJ [Oscillospiraceae bacterium]|nr:sporulation protein YtfJ [Oscillospiraceae bacterium]
MDKQQTVQELMANTLGKMRELVDSNTVIGTPITNESGVTIIPVSKISFGFVSGGTDFANDKQKDLFGGAASSGASITPVGFLVINGTSVKFMQVAEGNRTIDRLINMMPEVIDKLEALIGKKTKKEPELVPADVNEETF